MIFIGLPKASHRFPGNNQLVDMTAISCFYDAVHNELRKVATLNAISHWIEQSRLPNEMLFLELGFNGVFTFNKSDFPSQMKYIRIDGNDSNKYLFQKEHLWNMAAKMAKNEKLMFIDSDMSPLGDVNWFSNVSDALDNCLFTQGFHTVHYLDQNNSVIPDVADRESFTSCIVNGRAIDVQQNVPGMVFCTSKTFVDAIGGFNYLPLGGGDSLFWNELYGVRQDQPWFIVFSRDEVREIAEGLSRKLGKPILQDVDVEINHFFHGDRRGRSYIQRQVLLATQYPVLDQIMFDDTTGLLAWRDKDYWFAKALEDLPTVNNEKERAANLVDKYIDYNKFSGRLWKLIRSNHGKNQMSKLDWIRRICQLVNECNRTYGVK